MSRERAWRRPADRILAGHGLGRGRIGGPGPETRRGVQVSIVVEVLGGPTTEPSEGGRRA
jgi:hypothetical protein